MSSCVVPCLTPVIASLPCRGWWWIHSTATDGREATTCEVKLAPRLGRARRSARGRAQRLELLVGELDRRGGEVVLEVRDARRAGDRQHHRRAGEQPGERELRRRRVESRSRCRSSGPPGPASSPVASGNHGMKPMPFASAVVEQRLRRAVGEVVAVLHRHDRSRSRCASTSSSTRHLGQADVADLALVLQRGQLADLVLERHLRVDAVELQEVDALDAEVAEAEVRPAGGGTRAGRPAASRPGPDRVSPALVAITRSSGYGCSASRISSSATNGPYESAVSMKSTPSSTARRSTRIASSWSSRRSPHARAR